MSEKDFQLKPITKGLGFQDTETTQPSSLGPTEDPFLDNLDSLKKGSSTKTQGNIPDSLQEEIARIDAEFEALFQSEDVDLNLSMDLVSGLDKTAKKQQEMPAEEQLAAESFNISAEMPQTFIQADQIAEMATHDAPAIPLTEKDFDTDAIKQTPLSIAKDLTLGPEEGLRPLSFSIATTTIDALVAFGISVVCALGLLSTARVEFPDFMLNISQNIFTQVVALGAYLALFQMYVIVARSFTGATLGDWACNHQLGNNKQIRSAFYPLRVLWRSILILITGGLFFPLLSALVRRDVLKYFGGLRLYKKTYK